MHTPWRPKLGDVIVRRPREAEIAPVQIHLRRRSVPVRGVASPMIVVYGFAVAAILGSALLYVPIANTTGEFTPPIKAIFTSVSAVTVTGLVVVDTATYWSTFGHAVIFALILIGGLGIMTGAALLLMLIGQRLGLQNQLAIREGLGVRQLGGLGALVRNIALTALTFELLGALALFLRWYVFDEMWPGVQLNEALWQSAFHAVSAFNNAGFVILPPKHFDGSSLVAFQNDYAVLAIMGILIIVGSISYLVLHDLVTVRRLSRLGLDTKLILIATVMLIIVGASLVFATEYSGSRTLGERAVGDKLAAATFESAISRTAGFSTLDWGHTNDLTNFGMGTMMFIGGASTSTAGGIKIGTFVVIVLTIFATVRARRNIQVFGREIPSDVVRQAMVVGAVAVGAIFVFTFLIVAIEDFPLNQLLFEIISAFGTVGLSTGITPSLGAGGQIILVTAMFVGRLGLLTLALLMQGGGDEKPYRFAEERVRIG